MAGSGAGARRTTPTRSPRSDRAIELGVNWIDTAPIYGFGRSEEVVGRALAQMSEKPYVFTKCGLEGRDGIGVNDLKAATIERQCEDSLRRLGVEAIDLYQIHWPDPDEDHRGGLGGLRGAP